MHLTNKEGAILGQLAAAGSRELYGLEMVKSSEGDLKLGTVYVTLNRLEEKGFVSSRKEDEVLSRGVPRRLYRLTASGARAFDIHLAGLSAMAARAIALGAAA
jgi:DNA-binding PadR family transcriptional regulator